ncbi:flippase-like domain-containing protein [bacterium]|nr:flippase-like domain-containing protein [bacterium]
MKKTLFWILKLCISIGILWYVFSRPDISPHKIVEHIKSLELSRLLIAIGLYIVIVFIACLRWQELLKGQDIYLPFFKTLELNFIGLFFNTFMPSLTGGDVVKAYYVSKHTDKRLEAATTVLIDRIVGMLALLTIGAVASLYAISDPQIRKPAISIVVFFLMITILCIVFFNKRLMKKISFTVKKERWQKAVVSLKRVYSAFYIYRSKKALLAEVFLMSIVIQIMSILINYQIALGLGLNVSMKYFFLFIPIIATISVVPITFAGWGLGESMYKYFFGLVTGACGLAVTMSIIIRLIVLILNLFGGIFYIFHKPPKLSQDEQT